MRPTRPLPISLALALIVLATSCFLVSRSDPSRFYTLAATAEPAVPSPGSVGVGLGPISMPGYLWRPTLATRVDESRIRYSEFDRWAEPLTSQFPRTLAQDLSSMLATDRLVRFPWHPDTPLDATVRVDVLAFETDTTGTARLDAVWTVRDPHTGAVRRGDRSVITRPVDGGGPDAAVAALSQTLGALSQQIAAAIQGP